MSTNNGSDQNWLKHLESEDIAFLKRFLLNSGSLKQMAADYGVSYPTVRLRLDRLIQKVELIDEQTQADPFQIVLGTMLTDGRLDQTSFRKLNDAYLRQKQKDHDEKTTESD